MNKEAKKAQTAPPDSQSDLDRLLAEAMKQPGIATAMQLAEESEKYLRATAGYDNYLAWEQSPSCFSSCSTAPVN